MVRDLPDGLKWGMVKLLAQEVYPGERITAVGR